MTIIARPPAAGGKSYTYSVVCSETSGKTKIGNWTIDYSQTPGCLGTSCTMEDFNTIGKPDAETNYKNGLEKYFWGTTWNCTATASPFGSDHFDQAVLSVE